MGTFGKLSDAIEQVINLKMVLEIKLQKAQEKYQNLLRNNRVKRKLLKYLEVSLSRVMEKLVCQKHD